MPYRAAAIIGFVLVLAGSALCQAPHQVSAELQSKIDSAIDRGVEYLLSVQERDGSWAEDQRDYRAGQTALSAYALLKCGLAPEHSALRRALLFLAQEAPKETYSAGCWLTAMAAARRPDAKAVMEPVLRDLLKWQRGAWTYGATGIADLSNTQYAALGLRAAHDVGLTIPTDAWAELAQAAMKYQEKAHVLGSQGVSRAGRAGEIGAGFRYRNVGDTPVTGSMTAAGIGILAIVKECAGARLPNALIRKMETSIEWGLAWIAAHYSVVENPEKDDWYFYWMYGLERVGSLLKVENVGPHAWYAGGAAELVRRQASGGDWSEKGHRAQSSTCFALLFLERASAAVTGSKETKRPFQYGSDTAAADLRLRASGGGDGTPLDLWVQSFSPALVRAYTQDGAPVAGLRVARVEYLVQDEVVASVLGKPHLAWTTESYAARYSLARRGRYQVRARALIVDPAAPLAALEPVSVIESQTFEVDARAVHESWMDAAAVARTLNLLAPANPRAQASSEEQKGRAAGAAVDGMEATCWTCKAGDKAPWITVVSSQAVYADTLILTQMHGRERHRGGHDLITKVRIKLNGAAKPLEVTLEADELRPTVVPLGQTLDVRKIEIAILERVPGKHWPGLAGFAEISLEKR
jgi:hypothetical protein